MRKIIVWSLVGLISIPTGYFVQRNLRFASFRDIAVKEGAWYDVRMYGAIAGDQISDVPAGQAAADSIKNDGGGTLFFPPGQYEFYGDSIRIYSNTTISAYGAVFNDTTGGAPFFVIDGDSDIVFLGGEWNGNADIDGGYNEFTHGIDIRDAFRIWVEDVYMHDIAGDGIYFADVDYGTVTNSTIIITHLQNSPFIGRNCIAVVEGDNFVFSGNLLEGGSPAGIDLEPNAGLLVRNVVVSNNVVLGGFDGAYGISLFASASAATRCDSIVVDGNYISTTPQYGILVQQASRYQVTNNTINSPGRQGILVLDESSFGKISGNFIYNAGTAGAANSSGIEIQDSTYSVSITNNDISNSERYGIKIAGTSGNENNNLTITGNRCWNNDRSNNSTYSGIKISFTDSSFVDNNFCYDDQATHTQLYGFDIDNCDELFFGPSNWGYGNKTRLLNLGTIANIRLGGIVAYSWSVDNVAATTGNTTMFMAGGTMGNFTVPFDCQIISLSSATSTAVTQGSISLNVETNESAAGFGYVLTNQFTVLTLLNDSDSDLLLSAGDRIRVIYSSTADFLPDGSLDMIATILVKY